MTTVIEKQITHVHLGIFRCIVDDIIKSLENSEQIYVVTLNQDVYLSGRICHKTGEQIHIIARNILDVRSCKPSIKH